MISYFIVFIILIVPKRKLKKYENIICFIVLTLFLGMRYDIGYDFKWYYELGKRADFLYLPIFKNAINEILKVQFDYNLFQYFRIEIFNKFLYKITWFLNSPQVIIFLYSFLSCFFIKKGIDELKIKNNSKYCWLFFYTFPLFYLFFANFIRQGLASALVFFSYRYIKKEKFIKFLIVILIATLVHNSAKYMVIIYLLKNINIKRLYFIAIFILSFFTKKVLIYILSFNIFSKYYSYTLGKFQGGGEKIYYLIILMGLGLIFFSKKLKKFNEENNFIINTVFLGICLYISLNGMGHITYRVSMYFLIFIIYLIPDLLKIIKNRKILKIIFIFMCFMLLLLKLSLEIKLGKESKFLPYKFCITKENII